MTPPNWLGDLTVYAGFALLVAMIWARFPSRNGKVTMGDDPPEIRIQLGDVLIETIGGESFGSRAVPRFRVKVGDKFVAVTGLTLRLTVTGLPELTLDTLPTTGPFLRPE